MRSATAVESLLKGLFLGWCTVFVLRAQGGADVAVVLAWQLGFVAFVLAGLSISQRWSRAIRPGSTFAWLLLTILDHPRWIQSAVLGGLAASAVQLGWPWRELGAASIAGTLTGFALHARSFIAAGWMRRAYILLILGVLGGGGAWLIANDWIVLAGSPTARALAIALSAAGYYLLLFSGLAEETEAEVGVLAAALALALGQAEIPPLLRGAVVLLPLGLFVVYCERVRKGLVVFKHSIRGLGYEQQGNLRDALVSYRRALVVNPRSDLAQAGNWRVHRRIDLSRHANDAELIELVDPLVCLERARSLLGKATPETIDNQSEEITNLLAIVAHRRPDLPATIGYERLRLALARTVPSEAIAAVTPLIDALPARIVALEPHELEALFRIWSACLTEPLLVAEGSLSWLDRDDRYFAFLCTLERRLAQWSADPVANSFRPFLHDRLTWVRYERYLAEHPRDSADWIDFGYVFERAETLADEATSKPTDQRAGERPWMDLFRIAEVGLPARRLEIWRRVALVLGRDDPDQAEAWCRRVKELALGLGWSELSDAGRLAFFESVRFLAEREQERGELNAAIEDWQYYTRSPQSGVATLAMLERLCEQAGNLVSAIRACESALSYRLTDADARHWRDTKVRIYREVNPADVRSRLGNIEDFFDFSYCYRQALRRFEAQAPTDEITHYLDLAVLGGSDKLRMVNYLLGRTHLRAEKWEDAARCFEAVRSGKKAGFADADEEDAYFNSCRLLGDLALDRLGNPQLAVECFVEYKESHKSGADTLFKLARAYEACGQPAHARKWYDMVLVYGQHPKADAARAALARLSSDK